VKYLHARICYDKTLTKLKKASWKLAFLFFCFVNALKY
jgi:hypothetical protein